MCSNPQKRFSIIGTLWLLMLQLLLHGPISGTHMLPIESLSLQIGPPHMHGTTHSIGCCFPLKHHCRILLLTSLLALDITTCDQANLESNSKFLGKAAKFGSKLLKSIWKNQFFNQWISNIKIILESSFLL